MTSEILASIDSEIARLKQVRALLASPDFTKYMQVPRCP